MTEKETYLYTVLYEIDFSNAQFHPQLNECFFQWEKNHSFRSDDFSHTPNDSSQLLLFHLNICKYKI